jgi:hypothetical protein
MPPLHRQPPFSFLLFIYIYIYIYIGSLRVKPKQILRASQPPQTQPLFSDVEGTQAIILTFAFFFSFFISTKQNELIYFYFY